MPIKSGNTKTKDVKKPIIKRTPIKIFYQGIVIGFVQVKFKELNTSMLRLKIVRTVRSLGIKKSVGDGK